MWPFKKKEVVGDEEDANALKRNVEMTEHKENIEELLGRLKTNVDTGLTAEQVKVSFEQYGENVITPPPSTPEWLKFLRELTGFFSLLLWAGAILCFVGYAIEQAADNLYLGIVLVTVVMVTGIFSYLQNSKSENLMASFAGMLPPKVKVVRDGAVDEMVAIKLLPGDIVFIEGGDLVPADVRILTCSDNLVVDNSALTGESEPQKRSVKPTNDDPLETQNLCFFGTQVPEGSLKGVVVLTGDNTVMGRIAKLAMSTSSEQTPINKELHHFIIIISAIAISLGLIFLILGFVIGTPIVENLVFMIGIIVANVPEGLLATVTVCLTLTAKRMFNKKVLVKNLEGVETLGSTSCICSDKTGTLTQNIMTVAKVVYGEASGSITHDAPSSFTGGRKTYDVSDESFRRLLRCSVLCNVATFNESSKWLLDDDEEKITDADGSFIPVPFEGQVVQGDGSTITSVNWKPVGNASECAMLKLVQTEASGGIGDAEEARKFNPSIFVIPFNSKNKYQVHVHDIKDGPTTVLMKGAPERILDRCSHILLSGRVVVMTEAEKQSIVEQQEELSRNGLRCLGFAERELTTREYPKSYKFNTGDEKYDTANFPLGEDKKTEGVHPNATVGLVFLGLMALIDPPRPAVPPAVAKCKTAGVKVIMVTGDHPVTAQAIAERVGILWSKTRGDMERDNERFGRSPGDTDWEDPDSARAIVVPGSTISVDMPEERWDFILDHPQIVFARTSPQQKLVIVENNQRLGHIVAVTGDGVNDSPAIKKADIGIAMGISGSEVSKSAADMILVDDNFASIVNGVEEGRLIFDNLKKSIAYTIQSNIPEITPFLGFIIFAIPLPLTTILILAIDLGTDMIPAISFAYETAEADIMTRPPRNSKTDRLVTRKMINFSYLQIGLIQAFAGFFTYMVVLNSYGFPPWILLNRGSAEFWGVQPLFCKFKGGIYVNQWGEIDPILTDPSTSAPRAQYPLWAESTGGYVDTCVYPLKNFIGTKTGGNVFSGCSNDVNSATWCGRANIYNQPNGAAFADGHHQTPYEAIRATEAAGYYRYIPFKSKTSPFWEDAFLYWDTTQSFFQTGNLPFDGNLRIFFSGAIPGLYSVCDGDTLLTPTAAENANFRGAEKPDRPPASTSICPTPPQQNNGLLWPANGDTAFSQDALYCNGLQFNAMNFAGTQSCESVNYPDTAVPLADTTPGSAFNPHQTFYCYESCGRFVSANIEDLFYCPKAGQSEMYSCGNFVDVTCSFPCARVCYPPVSMSPAATAVLPSNGPFNGPLTTDPTPLRQCMNIGAFAGAGQALKQSQGAFWGAIVIVQIAGLLCMKTRWLSLRSQGMKNSFMNFGIFFEILLVSWLAYFPPLNYALGTANIRLTMWFPAIPFAIFIFVYDETRKALMRSTSPVTVDKFTGQTTRKAGWIERFTYY
ncbi:hypothetical protein TrVE_jg8358 [Triparma verrucosa]|uniref:Cation-transporting P-type ATPase N-terminal domain-containing protein n=1 Tax=Triparma verrucosa TaxID=1606542 RepID=A0A9W7CM87_9STRA|nr:hypothetical protein TrVE_jg8358 [Triparma verrucosa]